MLAGSEIANDLPTSSLVTTRVEVIDLRFIGGWKKVSEVLAGLPCKITAVGKNYRAFQWFGLVLQHLVDGEVERVEICSGTAHTPDKGSDIGPIIPQVNGEGLRRGKT
jgi:hypothetical protein